MTTESKASEPTGGASSSAACAPKSPATQDEPQAARRVQDEDWEGAHKVVMRNIPNRITPAEVLEALESMGFGRGSGDVEHFCMPWRTGEAANCGYAVLEFRDPAAALHFRNRVAGFQFPNRTSCKKVVVTPWRSSQKEPGAGTTRPQTEPCVQTSGRRKLAPRSWEVPETRLTSQDNRQQRQTAPAHVGKLRSFALDEMMEMQVTRSSCSQRPSGILLHL